MGFYKIYLPTFTRKEVNRAFDLLKKEKLECEADPHFSAESGLPYDQKMRVSVKAPRLKGWKYQDETIVTALNILAQPFQIDQAMKASRGGIGALFGMKSKDPYFVELARVLKQEKDLMIPARLRLCNVELTVIEHETEYGSTILAPVFAAALAQANRGLIFEGEFFKESNVVREFWPIDGDFEDLNEEEKDGLKPRFFSGWN
ncbi:MAG: hypothetical protein KC777_09970 [Cyanobacteria bacterium HKST-UBA02]|nr:hypothetical protein [Cyanobacteria bacterium HKST-UBA02]